MKEYISSIMIRSANITIAQAYCSACVPILHTHTQFGEPVA